MLSKIHAAFSPEEMLPVIVGPRNEGSTEGGLINFAGRARENVTRYRKFRPERPLIETPSCETGLKRASPGSGFLGRGSWCVRECKRILHQGSGLWLSEWDFSHSVAS